MNHKNLQKKSRIVAKDTRDYLIVDAETHNGFNEAIAPTGSPAEETEESKILAENSPPNSSLSPPASPSSPSSSSSPRILLWGLPLLAIALGVSLFAYRRLSNPVQTPEPPAPVATEAKLPVRVVKAQSAPIQEWVHSDGFVSAVRGKHLTFEVAGTITYIKKIDGRDLREGDYVFEGELLAQVDDRKLQADLTQSYAQISEAQEQKSVAEANLAQTRANLGQAQATVEQQQANVAQAKAKLGQVRASLAQAEARKKQTIANVTEAKANLEARIADRDLAEVELSRRQELYDEGVISASDRDLYQNKLDNAEAAVDAAHSRIQAAEEEVEAANSQIQAVKQDIAAAQSQVAAAESQVRAANSQVQAVEGNIAAAIAQIDATAAGIESARAQSHRANVSLEDTEIRAPFDGIVAFLNIREGDYWSPQRVSTQTYQDVVESVPIIVIDPSEFEVHIELPAYDGAQVNPGQTAFVVLDEDLSGAYRDRLNNENLISIASAEGQVFSVSPSVTPGGRAVNVRVRITSIEPAKRDRLRNGARVSVWIAIKEASNTTVIPLNAVVYRDQKPHVFVVKEENGKQFVEQREIMTGIEGISEREILEGVEPGELLVTEGKNRLVNGAPVDVVN
jgi:HlyD family secretion protein